MRRTMLLTLAIAGVLGAPLFAQPDRREPSARGNDPTQRSESRPDERPDQRRDARPDPRPDLDTQALRERLQRRLEETDRARERLRAAIERLDAGADQGEVARAIGRDIARERLGSRDDRRGDRRGGPRDRREGFAPWRSKPEPVSDAELAELRAFAKEHLPRLHERMEMLAERNPQAEAAGFARLAPRLREVMRGFDNGPVARARLAEFRAGLDVVDAGRALRSAMRRDANDGELATARADLRSAVEAGYDARLAVAEAEIVELEARVAELRERLASASQSRDADISEKVDELTDRIEAEAGND